MPRSAKAKHLAQVALIVGCVVLFAGFGLLVYSRFCTSIGMAGLYNRAAPGIGFILFGIAMLIFTPCLYLQSMHRKRIDVRALACELKGILLGFCCYALPFLLAMGALASAEDTGAFGLVLAVAFGAIPFAYRRHRKKNPISYEHTGAVAMVALCGALPLGSLAGGSFSCSEMLDDLNGGWKQETFAFYSMDVNRPNGRGAMLTPTTMEVDLYRDGESVARRRADAHLTVNAQDWPEIERMLDEPLVEIRWYPKTRTLVGARVVGGSVTVGDALD
ncbi:MAG: hypothetical protein Q4B77_07285 [Coriobacteriaceae bacterium]|nr:hypothetical protein [Coriobacteriaceae bacterium]